MTWGPWQILLVLAIILMLFGGKKLPELARSLGKSLNEFKKGKDEGAMPDPPQVAPQPAPQVTQQAAPAASAATAAAAPETAK